MTTLHLSHKKMKNVNSKKCQSSVKKIKLKKIKTSSNKNLISEMHWNFPYIYIQNFKC
jgi:hypothetical protein